MAEAQAARLGFLRADFEALESNLHQATEHYERASSDLDGLSQTPGDASPVDGDDDEAPPVIMTSIPGTSLRRAACMTDSPRSASTVRTLPS